MQHGKQSVFKDFYALYDDEFRKVLLRTSVTVKQNCILASYICSFQFNAFFPYFWAQST